MSGEYFQTPSVWSSLGVAGQWFWAFFSFVMWKMKFVWLILLVIYFVKRKIAFKMGWYEKQCPDCAEYIKGQARVCPHCHAFFDDVK